MAAALLDLSAGELIHPVAIQEKTTTERPSGGHDDVWTEIATRRVHMREMDGAELMEARQVVEHATHKVRMRYFAGLRSTQHRLVWGTRIFDIGRVNNVEEANRVMIVTCEETVA